jgi:hypothetical protein
MQAKTPALRGGALGALKQPLTTQLRKPLGKNRANVAPWVVFCGQLWSEVVQRGPYT